MSEIQPTTNKHQYIFTEATQSSTNIPIPSYVRLRIIVFLLKNKMPSSKFIKIQRRTNCPHIYLFLHMYVSYLPLGKLLLVDNSFLQHTTHTTDLSFFSLPPFPRAKYLTRIVYVSSYKILTSTRSTIP
jgi:hypothetical protein